MLMGNSLEKVHLRACLGIRLGSLAEASLIPLYAHSTGHHKHS